MPAARRIVVEVEKGGRSLIRVADNGTGMGHDDALLALERYATSKIRDDNDLFAIRTLGFRGEALPSIASVSRFALVTREDGAQSGVEIRVDGGRIRQVSEVGAPVGTMITVRQLFYNTPARRKFLKTVATEMGHISDALASRALAHPEVYFRLSHNGRDVKTWPAAPIPSTGWRTSSARRSRRHLLPVEHPARRGVDRRLGGALRRLCGPPARGSTPLSTAAAFEAGSFSTGLWRAMPGG